MTLTGLLSGVTKFTLQHSDIGGYTTISLPLLRYEQKQPFLAKRQLLKFGIFQESL